MSNGFFIECKKQTATNTKDPRQCQNASNTGCYIISDVRSCHRSAPINVIVRYKYTAKSSVFKY